MAKSRKERLSKRDKEFLNGPITAYHFDETPIDFQNPEHLERFLYSIIDGAKLSGHRCVNPPERRFTSPTAAR